MIKSFTCLVVLFACFFAGRSLALSSLNGSPCYDTCHGQNTTTSGDLVCTDNDFTETTKGTVMTECLTCLQNSTYTQGPVSDSMLFLGAHD